ncbi:putative L-amino-acid oxidase [Triangularia setosa]|uniref:L-amino-acid oxidase n=1 Tax=Triangularia setosa TaxID=2587417 RepID=A0AAN7A9Y7_9PEZI|nr:putative L-amino-acid oxidase [Podospora setosa]
MKLWSAVLGPLVAAAAQDASILSIRIETRALLNSRLCNVYIGHVQPVKGAIDFTYGSCEQSSPSDAHHFITTSKDASQDRLIWMLPDDIFSGGCISAWSNTTDELLGRSQKQHLDLDTMARRRHARLSPRSNGPNSILMDNSTGIDVWGPWFDGVEVLKNAECSAVDAAAAKQKSIAIVGAGMSGLMAYLCLTQQGLSSVSLIEGGDRLGGRVQTVYLSGEPFDYSYQEMGPMRVPMTLTVANQTYNMSDHQLVFQLAEEMNKLNEDHDELQINVIDWLESGGRKLPNGGGSNRVGETDGQQQGRPGHQGAVGHSGLSVEEIFDRVNKALPCKDFCVEMANNMFTAHRKWLDKGLLDLAGNQWSEFAFTAEYLNNNVNDTHFGFWGKGASSFWDKLCEDLYLNTTTWKTIDGGMSRLPQSFKPLVDNAITMNRRIDLVQPSLMQRTVTLQSRDNDTGDIDSTTHDYVLFAEISELSDAMKEAISTLPYTSACKVALEFEKRFWEHLDEPIYGTCYVAGPDYPGIGSICYPSYNINGTGRGALLASYISNPEWTDRWAATSESEHVQYVLDAMVGIHGGIVQQQYTGKFSRVCGALDPLEGASWADPTVGQHQLYLPEYFKTHNNMIFIGEHTSYTHAWIASALESGIRGSVQLLLELGLVDEAKATVEKWMARWIEVVVRHGDNTCMN